MIKEVGDIKEEHGTNHAHAVGLLDFIMQEACSVRCQVASPCELHGSEEVVVEGV